MRNTRNWKHTTKQPKQYGSRESERTAWIDIMIHEEFILRSEDDGNETSNL